jgi:hypothetical protein
MQDRLGVAGKQGLPRRAAELRPLRKVTRRISAGFQSLLRGPQLPDPREAMAVEPPKS